MQPLSIHIESNYEENFNKLKNSAIDLSIHMHPTAL